jgi:hypothetical protein
MANDFATRRVLYEIPGMQSVPVRSTEFPGSDDRLLPVAIYGADVAAPRPAVVLVEGYPDAGFARLLGCRFMDMGWSVSSAQMLAASGFTAIAYGNREPVADLDALLAHLRARGGGLGVDAGRIALWATSGHGPAAIGALGKVEAGVFLNPYLFDQGGLTHVADAARTFKFAVPPLVGLPGAKPIFVVRSGKDEMPGLNASLDRFAALALAADYPLTLANHAGAPHAFDLSYDVPGTRHILQQAIAFLRVALQVP